MRGRRNGNILLGLFGFILLLPLVGLVSFRIYKSIVFGIDCSGHLKRAADANTVELAKQELEVSVSFLKNNKLTSGYTSVIYQTPDEDVGFWYQNLDSSLEELKKLSPEATSLEKSNVLIKLRETLLDGGEHVSVTVPGGISIFPNNKMIFWLTAFALLIALCGIATLIKAVDDY